MAVKDRFAAIAATEINTRGKGLVASRTRKTEGRFLPVTEMPQDAALWAAPSDREQLQAAMEALRQSHLPFLREYAPAMEQLRHRQELRTFQWREATQEDQTDFTAVLAGAGSWETVTIPHYGGPIGKAETIYRCQFTPDRLPEAGQAMFLHFCAVDYTATVYFNGKVLGTHEGFFAPFEFDCTANLRPGVNTLVVVVGNDFVHVGNSMGEKGEEFTGDKIYAATGPGYDDPAVGWHHCPPGMGIYQPVWLELRSRQFLSDLWVRPLPEENRAELHLEAYSCDVGKRFATYEIAVYGRNFSQTVMEQVSFRPKFEADDLNEVFTQALAVFTETEQAERSEEDQVLKLEKGYNYFRLSLPMENFRWWSPEEPWLYEVQVRVLDRDRQVLDTAKTSFGMRSFRMDETEAPKGMLYLNGKKCRLRGANTMGFEQQDVMLGDYDQLIEDILMAKACHMNFLRITQRPVQPEIYDYMDRLGLMAQTDLPLFGAVRRNKIVEAVRQAEEMEKLIRSHPCCIMVSYINEPAPDLKETPHLFASCEELSTLFDLADEVVHMQNPDRVTKHVDGDYDPPRKTLVDNHCYTCWYNGFGVDAGARHKGDWVPVPEDWYYCCGEFGAEGLEDPDFMRARYPKEWLPQSPEEEEIWRADRIIGCQSGEQHYMFYETPHTLADWVAWSQEYQAEATRLMTEAFRRDRRMVSFALHLFIDAFPSGWLKSVVDCSRTPKPAFYTYRNALTPTMISMRTDRFVYFAGEEADVEFWLCNDRPDAMEGLTLLYEARLPDGTVRSGQVPCSAEASDTAYLGEALIPLGNAEGRVQLRCALLRGEEVLHRNELTFRVCQRQEIQPPILWVPEAEGIAARLARELDASSVPLEQASCALIHDYSLYTANKDRLDDWVHGGGTLVFLQLEPGSYDLCGSEVKIKSAFMSPRQFVSRDTDHPWVRGFDRMSFRFWYDADLDRISPLLATTFTGDLTPVLTSGNTDDEGKWGPVQAVGETACGKGRVVLCQLSLAARTRHNPAARTFALRMLGQ